RFHHCSLEKAIIMNRFKLYILGIIAIAAFLSACSKDSAESSTRSDTGVAGSTARFVVVNDRLYTVDNEKLHIFDVSTPSSPVEVQQSDLQSQLNGSRIETIFAKGNILFIG